ncbi:hypothetical protein N2152v2_008063 [Parachlorella kessleri]
MQATTVRLLVRTPFSAAKGTVSSRKRLLTTDAARQRRKWCRAAHRGQQHQQGGNQPRQLQQLSGRAPLLLLPALLTSPAQAATSPAELIFELADLDSKTAGAVSAVLRPVLSVACLLMIVRIVMSWYPEIDGKSMPWTIAFTPTEPLLAATRKVVKPFNGLDVSPIVWVALLSFVSEILTGPQGILSLIERKGI